MHHQSTTSKTFIKLFTTTSHVTGHSREPCVHSMVGHPIERAVVPNSQEHTDATSKFTIQLIQSEFTMSNLN